jgi:hypothetical protein
MTLSLGFSPVLGQRHFSGAFQCSQVTDKKEYLVGRDGFEPSTNWLKASPHYAAAAQAWRGFHRFYCPIHFIQRYPAGHELRGV